MSMKVEMLDGSGVFELEDSYAVRLIEQGYAVLVSGDTPIPPKPQPIDPSQYGAVIEALQEQAEAIQKQIDGMKADALQMLVHVNMHESIAQAEMRRNDERITLAEERLEALNGTAEGGE